MLDFSKFREAHERHAAYVKANRMTLKHRQRARTKIFHLKKASIIKRKAVARGRNILTGRPFD